jgi:hypothetical protein
VWRSSESQRFNHVLKSVEALQGFVHVSAEVARELFNPEARGEGKCAYCTYSDRNSALTHTREDG